MSLDLMKDLNPPQRMAVEHGEGPLLVLAGAGSGKTRVLTYRIAYLVRHFKVRPERILALTFTNKAAGEMKERLDRLLGSQPRLWIGTFHSVFARILRRHAEVLGHTSHYSIYDTDDSLALIKKLIKDLPADSGKLNPSSIRHAISRCKNDLRPPDEVLKTSASYLDRKIAVIYARYEEMLQKNNALDFDDLIIKPMELFRKDPQVLEHYRRQFTHILIDEYQDTNRAQYNLVRLLADKQGNICVVGDDDQSIYGWRGADIRNILEFERDFENVATIRLERNYRSTGNILEVANAVVSRNLGRKPKKLWTKKPAGLKAVLLESENEIDEAEQITGQASAVRSHMNLSWRDMAVLYRTNAQSRALEDALRKAGVPYRIIGGLRFYERKEIKDLTAYLKVLVNPSDSTSLYRIINVPARGIGPQTLTRLTALANELGGPLYNALGLADRAEGLSSALSARVIAFHAMMESLRQAAARESASEVLTRLLAGSGYEQDLAGLDTIEAQSRMENIAELVSAAEEFSQRFEPEKGVTCLQAWLAETSLVSEIDFHDPAADALTLMTLHNAKGLEFPVVFISGVEENLLPIGRAYEDETGAALEEERRLFYVGITRAKDLVYLSWASSRRRYSELLENSPSSFLRDIPENLLDRQESTRRLAALSRGKFGLSEGSYRGLGTTPIGPAPPIGVPRPAATRSAAAVSADPDFEWDPGADEPLYRRGERVVHSSFGSGTITEVGSYLDELRVTVAFDSNLTKKLIARFAKLRRE